MLLNLNTIDHSIIDIANRRPDALVINPSKTAYNYNQAIDKTTITVTCIYNDGYSVQLAQADWTLITTIANTDTISISYTYNGRTIQGHFNITIQRVLSSITVTSTRSSYPYNSTIDASTISVTSYYTDGTTDHPQNFTFTPGTAKDPNNAALGGTTVTVTYSETNLVNTITCNATFNITFTEVLDHITVTNTSTVYNYGDTINTADITVTAYFTGGGFSPRTVSGWTVSPTVATYSGEGLTATGPLTITYIYENVTRTVQTPDITVYKVLQSIKVEPSKTVYNYQETIRAEDMTVTAYYTDGKHRTLSSNNFTFDPATAENISNANAGTLTVTVSHEYRNIPRTASYGITIRQVPRSLAATLNSSYYVYNQAISVSSCVCTYTNNSTKTITNYAYSCGSTNNHTAAASTVTVSYTENGVTVSTSITIRIVLTASCYSGTANFRNQGNGNWYAELLTNGNFNLPCAMDVDLYMIGGGQGGGAGDRNTDSGNHNKTFMYGGPGGHGGCIYKRAGLSLNAGLYACTIGSGGAAGGGGTINTRGAVGGSTIFGSSSNFSSSSDIPIAHGGGVSRTNTTYEYEGAHGGSRGNYVGSYATPTGGFDGDSVPTSNPDLRDWLGYNRGGGGGGGMSEYEWDWAEHYSSTGSGRGGSMGGGKATKSGTTNYGGGGGGGEPGGAGAGGSGVIVIRNAR